MMEQMRAEGSGFSEVLSSFACPREHGARYELDVCTHTVAVTSMITAGELE